MSSVPPMVSFLAAERPRARVAPRQYLEEEGSSAGDLNLDLKFLDASSPSSDYGGSENPRRLPARTMNLFPEWDFRGNDPCLDSSKFAGNKEAGTAQMTVFYAGKVVVFDDVPAQRAKEVVMMASRMSFVGAVGPNPADLLPLVKKPVPRPMEPVPCDLPIARRASLHRFLEKRKDRLTAKAPYEKAGKA